MIDLHCHLLPGIDDGPATLDDTLALAHAAAAAGTRTIVATPHIDRRWNVDPARVPEMVESVRRALGQAHIELDVQPGGEVDLGRLADLEPAEVRPVRLGGGPYLLLECPHQGTAGSSFEVAVHMLRQRGERIVLAHPERSPTFQKDAERLVRLVGDGVLTSITASSLLGRFGRRVQDVALDFLQRGIVHNIASDSHDALGRGPGLLAGINAAERELPGVLAQADWLTVGVPEAVLAGREIPPSPAPPRRRRRWRIRGR